MLVETLPPYRDVKSLTAAANVGSPVPTWTISAFRNLLAHREKNGLAKYTIKVGARLLISEPGFYAWLAEQGSTHGPFSDDGEQPPEEGRKAPRRERRPLPGRAR